MKCLCYILYGRLVFVKILFVLFLMFILNIDFVNLIGNMCICIYL